MTSLEKCDPQVAAILASEVKRQSETLDLISSGNHCRGPVMEAMGSVLTDKYAEGYPHRRYYCGNENTDAVEQLCIDRAKALFGADHANVQPHSGTSANLAVYMACLKPGAKIMGMNLAHGGHLSHGMHLNISGMVYKTAHYGVDPKTERLDMDEIRRMALAERPARLIAGASAYPRTIDFGAFGEIAREAGCMLMCDIAHIAGLVAAGEHPDPVPHSDFVTTTNHKTLRGPRGGIILCRAKYAEAVDRAVFPGIQGGPLEHVIAAKAVSLAEAMHPAFKTYAKAIRSNATALAEAMLALGWRLVSGGTDNHLMLVDLHSRYPNLNGAEASTRLSKAALVVNSNPIPFDPTSISKWSGIRLGTPAVTTRGLGAGHMKQIAGWIDRVLAPNNTETTIAAVRAEVIDLCRLHPVPNSSY
ncbi:MAG: serine hydroxymethyltransferase [Planctomycetota bacterium]|nr:serine hydroxymethyltransferase [Planctomycetota bacterium]